MLLHTATHCNALQRTATHCNALQHTATHCKILQHTVAHCNLLQHTMPQMEVCCNTLQRTATHCNTLHHTATHCAADGDMLQHTATHCNTFQHTATHCNMLCRRWRYARERLSGSLLQVSFHEYISLDNILAHLRKKSSTAYEREIGVCLQINVSFIGLFSYGWVSFDTFDTPHDKDLVDVCVRERER